MPVAHIVLSFAIAVFAGAFGAILGIGGGLFIIPSLNLFLAVKLKTAIAASIVAVVATSLAGGNVYLRSRLADARLGLLLALATVPGATVGAVLATIVSARVLAGAFALVLALSAWRMLRPSAASTPATGASAGGLTLAGAYRDAATGNLVGYAAQRLPLGVGLSVAAGLVSGLLGVGGGIIQVPVMNLVMHVPLKVATTTSTYIIGITAMAGAFVYYNHRPSYIDPQLAVPVTLGVVLGATAGTRILARLDQHSLRLLFGGVAAIYAVQMVLRVFGVGGA